MASSVPSTKCKTITCILPKGKSAPLISGLKEKGITRANFSLSRGFGIYEFFKTKRLPWVEKEVLAAIVPEDRAEEIFEYLFYEAEVDRPGGGVIYIGGSPLATDYVLPEVASGSTN